MVVAGSKLNTTAPPPFDPEEFARASESTLRAASDTRRTAQIAPPPLNKRVRIAVRAEDLEWFDMTPEARKLLARIDGTKTLFDLLEGTADPELLKAIAELHDSRILAYDD